VKQNDVIKTLSTVSALVIVAACAQTEPAPQPIAPEPVFDKYGNEMTQGGGCSGGQYAAGADSNCIPTGDQGYEQGYDQDSSGGDGDGDGAN